MKNKPVIAISGCLLGEEIRHDGQHKRNPHVVHDLAGYFEFQRFCPEVSMGLGIPRPAIRLVRSGDSIKLVNSKDSSIDHTETAFKIFRKIDKPIQKVSGVIFTSKSPSCGYDPVNVYDEKTGSPANKSRGLWAHHLEELYPLIPKISSGRLHDDEQRSAFRTKVSVYSDFMNSVLSPKDLVNFHEVYKYYLMQYGAIHLKTLGRICSTVTKGNLKKTLEEYSEYLFGTVFQKTITFKNRTNVFEHLAGYLKKELNTSDKSYLHESIKAYHKEKLNFETLLTLLEFLVKSYDQEYLKKQMIFKLYSQRGAE